MRKWRSQLFAETLSVDKIGKVHKQVAFKLFVSNAPWCEYFLIISSY